VLIIYSTNTEYQSHILTATDRSAFDKKSFAQLQLSELSERDTGKKLYHVDKHYFLEKLQISWQSEGEVTKFSS